MRGDLRTLMSLQVGFDPLPQGVFGPIRGRVTFVLAKVTKTVVRGGRRRSGVLPPRFPSRVLASGTGIFRHVPSWRKTRTSLCSACRLPDAARPARRLPRAPYCRAIPGPMLIIPRFPIPSFPRKRESPLRPMPSSDPPQPRAPARHPMPSSPEGCPTGPLRSAEKRSLGKNAGCRGSSTRKDWRLVVFRGLELAEAVQLLSETSKKE